jgi:hypothetical protein
MLHVRICAGGAGPTSVPTATKLTIRLEAGVARRFKIRFQRFLDAVSLDRRATPASKRT